MARYSADSREQVRDAIDMLDLVSARTELRRAGASSHTGLCPFHDERTPSFSVDPLKKVYHCFGCGAGGDAFRFVMETEGVDFPGALELLADRYGVALAREQEDPAAAARRQRRERLLELLARTAQYYARCLWEADEARHARTHLTERGLGEEVVRAFGVGYAPSAWDHMLVRWRRAGYSDQELRDAGVAQRSSRDGSLYDRFRGRLMFPLSDVRGRVLGFGARRLSDSHPAKYINSPESELYQKRRRLFGADRARVEAARSGEVVVVEGYTDVLALHQAGLTATVGLMGTALAEEQMSELARLAPRVALALDADASGQEAMVRAARVAAARSLELRVVELPAGSDPADLVAAEGADAMRARVEGSVPFARFRAERVLGGADLASADGRDRALAQLREVLSELAPSALREELVRMAAGRLGLSETLVASLGAAPAGGAGGSGSGAGAGAGRSQAPLDRREETERAFLALCIAVPEEGRRALASVDLERHFTGAPVRRAAAHLKANLVDPLAGLGPEDADLSALLAELSLRATRLPADAGTLKVQALQLEAARLDREIAAARADSRLDVSQLATERVAIRERLDSAMEEAMEKS
jgi:DNA primase